MTENAEDCKHYSFLSVLWTLWWVWVWPKTKLVFGQTQSCRNVYSCQKITFTVFSIWSSFFWSSWFGHLNQPLSNGENDKPNAIDHPKSELLLIWSPHCSDPLYFGMCVIHIILCISSAFAWRIVVGFRKLVSISAANPVVWLRTSTSLPTRFEGERPSSTPGQSSSLSTTRKKRSRYETSWSREPKR